MSIRCRFVGGIGGETILDLNDEVTFYLADNTLFPLPEVLYNWVENVLADGRRLANWRIGGNAITLNLAVRGTNEQDAYNNLNLLLAELLKEQTLEVRLWGADESVYYHTYPALPKLPDMVRDKHIIQPSGSVTGSFILNVVTEIPVDHEVKLDTETLTVLEALGVNDSFEMGTQSTVNWTERQPAGNTDANWVCCSSDSDGSNLIACVYGGGLYTSDDSGATWAEREVEEPTVPSFADPGFEAGAGDAFTYFDRSSTDPLNVKRSSASVKSGTYSCKIRSHSPQYYVTTKSNNRASINPLASYDVKVWCMSYSTNQIGVNWSVFFYNSGGSLLGFKTSSSFTAPLSWTQKTISIEPGDYPSGTVEIGVRVRGACDSWSNGSVYWDDITVTVTSSPPPILNWRCCASDSDGSNLIAGVYCGRLYTSDDSGETWTERQPAGDIDANWRCCASDADGSNLIAVDYGGRVWTSDDSGATWDERQPAGDNDKNWVCCASDSDGSNLIVGVENGRLYTSDDSGATWDERQPGGDNDLNWRCCSSDSDGSNLIAGIYGGRLYTSDDSGATWDERQPAGNVNKDWSCCSSDSDGSNLIAGVYGGRLYLSEDNGATWMELRPAGPVNKLWNCCNLDDDGSNIIAGIYGGRLYTGILTVCAGGATGWDFTETNAGTVAIGSYVALDGDASIELETTDGGTDVAAITDAGYIDVNSRLHYQCMVFAYEYSGNANVEVDIACYDDAAVLLDTLNIVEDYDPDAAKWYDICEVGGDGVINPVGGDAPAFPAGTTQIKRTIRNNSTVASTLCVDRLWFGCTEYIAGYKVSGAMGFIIPPTDIFGILPTRADWYFDVVYDRFTDLVLAQRDLYSADFDPVQEPGGDTKVILWTRRSQDYHTVSALANLLLNPDFETYAGDPVAWGNWTATRSGISGAVLTATTDYHHAGLASVRMGRSSGGTCNEKLLSDKIAVDPGETYVAQLWTERSGPHAWKLTSSLIIEFYDVGDNKLGQKALWAGYPPNLWTKIIGYVYPDDFPVGTTQAAIRLTCKGTTPSLYGYHHFDDMLFAELDSKYIEAAFPIDAHEGRAFVSGGFSFGATSEYGELTSHTFIRTAADAEITPHIELKTADIGDANTDFQEVFKLARVKISIPSHAVSTNADLSYLNQVVRVATDPLNDKDIWYDHIALLYYDRAITEITNWTDADSMILDSRSGRAVLVSLDGTLNTAAAYDHQNWKGPPAFEADPDGMNLTLLAVKENELDDELSPICDICLIYNPTYLLTATSVT